MDGFALMKFKDAPGQRHALRFQAREMHLDAACGRIEMRVVAERRGGEIGPEFAVDARQHVEIESGGDALRVVVRCSEHGWIFLEIDAYQCAAASAELRRPSREE